MSLSPKCGYYSKQISIIMLLPVSYITPLRLMTLCTIKLLTFRQIIPELTSKNYITYLILKHV